MEFGADADGGNINHIHIQNGHKHPGAERNQDNELTLFMWDCGRTFHSFFLLANPGMKCKKKRHT